MCISGRDIFYGYVAGLRYRLPKIINCGRLPELLTSSIEFSRILKEKLCTISRKAYKKFVRINFYRCIVCLFS